MVKCPCAIQVRKVGLIMPDEETAHVQPHRAAAHLAGTVTPPRVPRRVCERRRLLALRYPQQAAEHGARTVENRKHIT